MDLSRRSLALLSLAGLFLSCAAATSAAIHPEATLAPAVEVELRPAPLHRELQRAAGCFRFALSGGVVAAVV